MMNFKENMDLNNILAKAIYLIDFIYPPAKAGGHSIHWNEALAHSPGDRQFDE